MARYALHHRNAANRALHLVGVPLITYGLFVGLARVRLPLGLDAAALLYLAGAALYLRFDRPVVFLTLGWVGGLYALAREAAFAPGGPRVAAACFVGGWVIQLAGHAIEGRRPALVENLFQILAAPVFISLELLYGLGFYRDVRAEVRDLVREME